MNTPPPLELGGILVNVEGKDLSRPPMGDVPADATLGDENDGVEAGEMDGDRGGNGDAALLVEVEEFPAGGAFPAAFPAAFPRPPLEMSMFFSCHTPVM